MLGNGNGIQKAMTWLAAMFLLTAAALALGTATASATALPAYASVTYRVSSGAAWTTISFVDASVVDANVTSSSTAAKTEIGSNGISVIDREPSLRDGSNTLPTAQTTVNLVYSFTPGQPVTFQVCKGDAGAVSVTLSRNEDQDTTQLASLTDSNSGQGNASDGCQNESSTQLDQATVTGPGIWPAPVDPNRHVLALYYPWYDATTFQTGSWAETPNAPSDTSDPASVGAQIDEARAQHIDGFVVSYDGNRVYAQRLSIVTQQADSRPGFYVAPLLEMNQLVNDYTWLTRVAGIASAIGDAVSRTSGPSQLQVNGRPVVFVFAADDLSVNQWKAVRAKLGVTPFFVADTTNSAYGFDGLYNYTSNFAADDQIAGLDQGYEQAARWDPAVNSGQQRLWVAPVSPGEDSCVSDPPDDQFYVDREAGARYDYAWQAALASEPEWVLISTWNEWFEDTSIAPGSLNGTRALDETGPYAASFETDPTQLPATSYTPPDNANASQACP